MADVIDNEDKKEDNKELEKQSKQIKEADIETPGGEDNFVYEEFKRNVDSVRKELANKEDTEKGKQKEIDAIASRMQEDPNYEEFIKLVKDKKFNVIKKDKKFEKLYELRKQKIKLVKERDEVDKEIEEILGTKYKDTVVKEFSKFEDYINKLTTQKNDLDKELQEKKKEVEERKSALEGMEDGPDKEAEEKEINKLEDKNKEHEGKLKSASEKLDKAEKYREKIKEEMKGIYQRYMQNQKKPDEIQDRNKVVVAGVGGRPKGQDKPDDEVEQKDKPKGEKQPKQAKEQPIIFTPRDIASAVGKQVGKENKGKKAEEEAKAKMYVKADPKKGEWEKQLLDVYVRLSPSDRYKLMMGDKIAINQEKFGRSEMNLEDINNSIKFLGENKKIGMGRLRRKLKKVTQLDKKYLDRHAKENGLTSTRANMAFNKIVERMGIVKGSEQINEEKKAFNKIYKQKDGEFGINVSKGSKEDYYYGQKFLKYEQVASALEKDGGMTEAEKETSNLMFGVPLKAYDLADASRELSRSRGIFGRHRDTPGIKALGEGADFKEYEKPSPEPRKGMELGVNPPDEVISVSVVRAQADITVTRETQEPPISR